MHTNNHDRLDPTIPQDKPAESLSPRPSTDTLESPEIRYRNKVRTQHSMDWLYEHHIVFNLLPEARVVQTIAEDEALKLRALGSLDYLAEEPEKEHVGMLPIIISAVSLTIGVMLGSDWNMTTFLDYLVVFVIAGATISFLTTVNKIIKKNTRIKSVAAWAHSWRTAIREYEC